MNDTANPQINIGDWVRIKKPSARYTGINPSGTVAFGDGVVFGYDEYLLENTTGVVSNTWAREWGDYVSVVIPGFQHPLSYRIDEVEKLENV